MAKNPIEMSLMQQFFEFLLNHYLLATAWVVLFIMVIRHESGRGGTTLSPQQATNFANQEGAVILDIRKKEDFRTGHLPEAINIPYAEFDSKKSQLDQYKERPVLVVCNTGTTAGPAGTKLRTSGFTNVARLNGGIMDWKASKLPLVTK